MEAEQRGAVEADGRLEEGTGSESELSTGRQVDGEFLAEVRDDSGARPQPCPCSSNLTRSRGERGERGRSRLVSNVGNQSPNGD